MAIAFEGPSLRFKVKFLNSLRSHNVNLFIPIPIEISRNISYWHLEISVVIHFLVLGIVNVRFTWEESYIETTDNKDFVFHAASRGIWEHGEAYEVAYVIYVVSFNMNPFKQFELVVEQFAFRFGRAGVMEVWKLKSILQKSLTLYFAQFGICFIL